MNLQTFTLPRFLTRTKRSEEPRQERVEGIYLQEGSFGIALGGTAGRRNDLPAGTVLAETTRTACKNSAAATPLFVP